MRSTSNGMLRALLLGALAVAWLAGPTHAFGAPVSAAGPVARASIYGGSVTSIQQAPWTVHVAIATLPSTGYPSACTGVILSRSVVITAAHCTADPNTDQPLPTGDLTVVAGISNVGAPSPGDHPQAVSVGHVTVHPDYNAAGCGCEPGDDIAVLTLAQPLALSTAPGTDAESISLAPAPTTLSPGMRVDVAGFGLENPLDYLTPILPDGTLNSLPMTLEYTPYCQSADTTALFLCATSPAGSVCESDSGGPVTIGSPPLLVGIVSGFYGGKYGPCLPGDPSLFTNITAPETQAFLAGSSPPQAPRGGTDIGYAIGAPPGTEPTVGDTMTCNAGTWSNAPTLTYEFIADPTDSGPDTASGVVRQSGSSTTYTFTAADVGMRLYCLVLATNAGGTGSADTVDSPPVADQSGVLAPSTQRTKPTIGEPPSNRAALLRPELRLVAISTRVATGGGAALQLFLASRTALKRVRLCVTTPVGVSIAVAARAAVRGRRACWTTALRARSYFTVPFIERLHARLEAGALTTTATASNGLAARATVFAVG